MRTPLDWWQQKQARQRYMPQPKRRSTGTTAKFAIVALIVIVALAVVLDLRRGTGAETALIEHAQASREDPLDLIEAAARSRRLVLVADIPSAAAPKRFVADAVERLARGPGLDVLALAVPSDEQPFIERYLVTTPEDASILLSRPRAVREGDGASRALLDVYRAVWRVNQELEAARRLRIVAIDHPAWPPETAASPRATAERFGQRSAHMLETLQERVLARDGRARVLLLVDGLHVLKSGGGRVQTGGAAPVEVEWLAAQLARQHPQDVYSILVDASSSRVIAPQVAAYSGTAAGAVMRDAGLGNGFALRLGAPFNEISRTPIRIAGTTGLDFQLEPRTAPMTDLADAYVYFGN